MFTNSCYHMSISTMSGEVTRSSAVTKRPRDASCLSVLASIVQVFLISYFGFRFTIAYNSILLCCLRRNVEPCCHTQDSSPPWLCIARDCAWSISHCTQQHVDCAWSSNTCCKQKVQNTNYDAAIVDFEILAYPTCIWRPRLGSFHRNTAMPFGLE